MEANVELNPCTLSTSLCIVCSLSNKRSNRLEEPAETRHEHVDVIDPVVLIAIVAPVTVTAVSTAQLL